MTMILRPKNRLRAVLFLTLIGACVWAWTSVSGSLISLWLTPEQQGVQLMARQHYAEAAKRFRGPLWQGVALYRDG
jgi:hypothetical protein